MGNYIRKIMEARAIVRYVRMSPQKARLVVDLVRGEKVSNAVNLLRFTNKATARVIEKLILSARANAENKNVADPDEMKIKTIFVDKGPVMKRHLSRSRGRMNVVLKPFSHVTVVLEETEEAIKKKEAVAKKAEKKKGGTKKAKEEKPKATETKKEAEKEAKTEKPKASNVKRVKEEKKAKTRTEAKKKTETQTKIRKGKG